MLFLCSKHSCGRESETMGAEWIAFMHMIAAKSSITNELSNNLL